MTFTFVVFKVAVVRIFFVNGSTLTLIGNFRVWDIKGVFFGREFIGLPATFLCVVLDEVPETVGEIEFYREVRAFEVYEVSCIPSYCHICRSLEVLFGDISVSPLVEG